MATEPQDVSAQELIAGVRNYLDDETGEPLSIRGLARLVDVPYETMRDIVSGRTRNPTQETLDRIYEGLDAADIRFTTRSNTYSVDAPFFGEQTIRAIQLPPGAIDAKFIYRTRDTPSGRGTTDAFEWTPNDPQTMFAISGVLPSQITRIVFRRRIGR